MTDEFSTLVLCDVICVSIIMQFNCLLLLILMLIWNDENFNLLIAKKKFIYVSQSVYMVATLLCL